MAATINAIGGGSGGIQVTGDTTGQLQLQTAGTTAMTVNASQQAAFANNVNMPNTFGFKNRIINGAMMIDQRNSGAVVTEGSVGSTYFMDMWRGYNSGGSKFTVQQYGPSTSGYITPPAGFSYYAGIVSLSAYTVGPNDQFQFTTPIEGYNMVDLGWGTANAKAVTLSFWAYSSLTGTFPLVLRSNGSPSYLTYTTSYTITSANTWTYITITIPGNTQSGYWVTNNNLNLQITWTLGTGSNFIGGTNNTWNAGNFLSSSGSYVNFVANNAATLYVTGVQLEVGTQATSFDYRDYGRELALCQRYYQQIGKSNNVNYQPYGVGVVTTSTSAEIIINLPVIMRVTPALNFNGATNTFIGTGGSVVATSVASDIMSPSTIMYVVNAASGLTTGYGARHYQNSSSASSLELSAEL